MSQKLTKKERLSLGGRVNSKYIHIPDDEEPKDKSLIRDACNAYPGLNRYFQYLPEWKGFDKK